MVQPVTRASPPRAQGRWGGAAWTRYSARLAHPPSWRDSLAALSAPEPVAELRVPRSAGTGGGKTALRLKRLEAGD